MVTSGSPYNDPLRPRITIKTIEDDDTLYTYNAFDTSHDISVRALACDNAVGEMGTFGMTINDHDGNIRKDNIHNVKVFIEFGKTSTSFNHFLIGYGDIFNADRPATRTQFYNLSGFGSKLWLYQLYISRSEKYNSGDSKAQIKNIVTNAFTKRLWRPLKTQDQSIEDITGISSAGISTTIRTPYRIVDEHFTYFGDFLDKLSDITGAVWFVDYSTGEEILTYKSRPQLMTKVIIKSGDLADTTNDRPTKTAYIVGSFGIEDASTTEAGYANRLFSTTIQDSQEMWPLDAVNYAKGSSDLINKALGQQIVIDNDARRIESIELHLRRIDDIPNDDRLTGGVFLDKSNKPNMTNTLDIFHIDISGIEDRGTKIQVPVDISPKKLDNAQSKIWVVLFQIDEPGTIVWGHNNSFATEQKVPPSTGEIVYSGSAPGGDSDSKSKLSWSTTKMGPTYYVKVFSNVRRLFARTNGRSKRQTRLREQYIPTDFLNDPQDISRFLSLNLSQTSKARRAIGEFAVRVPDDFLFRPYQQVTFHDGLSDTDDVLQVNRASYVCDATNKDDSPLGVAYGRITLVGSYNTLVGACSCL